MQIKELLIYGFGKHENVKIELGAGMNVLYGSNEAGKTTIQQFILHILFGFPQKNSLFLRYEPKSGGKYGGQIKLIDDIYGECTIERVRGKSAGEVTVRFEDGTTGSDELLQLLLRQYDRASFESIFSFSLLQLQGFEKMDEDELSRTLLASGTTGVDSLLKVEKRMDKEMNDLFKKSGKLPEMNVKLAELRSLESELKIEMDKMDAYEPAVKRLQTIENRLSELREYEADLTKNNRLLTVRQQMVPLQKKRLALKEQLVKLKDVHFPPDGIRRYEALTSKLTEARIVEKKMKNELEQMKSRVATIEELDKLEAYENLLTKESEWLNWHTVSKAATDEIAQLTEQRASLLDRLGVKSEDREERVKRVDVSIQKEEEMHTLLTQLDQYNQQIHYAERTLSELEKDLNNLEEAIGSLRQSAPSNEQREEMRKWPEIQERLAEAKAYLALGSRAHQKQLPIVSLILLALAIICIVIGVLKEQWLLAIVGAVLGGVGVFYYTTQKAPTNDPKKRQMEEILEAYKGREREFADLQEKIMTVDREDERQQREYASLTAKYQQLDSELHLLRDRRSETENLLTTFLRHYGFEGMPSSAIIPELFRMIRNVQEIDRKIERALFQSNETQQQIALRLREAQQLLKKEVPQHLIYDMLRKEFLRLKEASELTTTLRTRISETEIDVIGSEELTTSLSEESKVLLAEANAATEADFYAAYDEQQEVKRLNEQLTDVQTQLAVHEQIDVPQHVSEHELAAEVSDNEKVVDGILEELNTLLSEQASLRHKTNQLLTEETVGKLRQLFEMKKAEFAELAKKWSERKVIAEAIRQTMVELREKKLPHVMHDANQIFSALTENAYTSLEVTELGTFEAVSNNGMRLAIVELSQATKEQAYISLRLALASSLLGSAPFPMLLDDPFVHFDRERLSRMIKLLDNLKTTHQFIYFTCHDTMKNQWPDATVLNVSEIGNR